MERSSSLARSDSSARRASWSYHISMFHFTSGSLQLEDS